MKELLKQKIILFDSNETRLQPNVDETYHLCNTFYGAVRGDGKSHEPFVFFGFIIDYCFERYQEVFTNY